MRRIAGGGIAISMSLFASLLPAHAVSPDEVLDDPALEASARAISAGLRCLVCQNQSIDDSDAELARDLRVIVRERLTAGDSNEEAVAYIVARYGEFVLLKPSFSVQNALLWISPFAILLTGGIALLVSIGRRDAPAPVELSETERAELDDILQGGDRKT